MSEFEQIKIRLLRERAAFEAEAERFKEIATDKELELSVQRVTIGKRRAEGK